MLKANRLLAQSVDYPIHLGVTEAGARTSALVKSSIGIGALLSEGIGDTVRVSLTDNPAEEVYAAREILRALEVTENRGMDIISCPTCGRTKINLIEMVDAFEKRAKAEGLSDMNIRVALMGCVVNGPGEAREADVGIAGGISEGLIFKRGEIIKKVKEENLIDELIGLIKSMKDEKEYV
jgi:(E)-4-hydroxy-3-methylbut-2-enyl-diphosphate synthase